jgi:hypothetical protein
VSIGSQSYLSANVRIVSASLHVKKAPVGEPSASRVGNDVVRPVDVEIVDLGARHELVDVNGASRFHLDGLKILVSDLDVAIAALYPFTISPVSTTSPCISMR